MSKKANKEKYSRLVSIANNHSNHNKCAECGASYPTWASYNLGILLCGRCANVHKRILGPPNQTISKVKSLTLDNWSDSQIDHLSKIGNKRANRRWNPKRIPFPYDGDEDVSAVEQYLRDKYIYGTFRDDNIDPTEYDDRLSKFSEDDGGYHSLRPLLRLRSSSVRSQTTVPRLTHRKLTTFEYTQYSSQAVKIRLFGYTDRDAVLESLLLSNGNIDIALDILELDSRINPTKEETAPLLPKRPTPQSQPSNTATGSSSFQTAAKATDEWWNTNQVAQQPVQATGMPQIYQYTDPITGQISYIDSNGQEYLDPNNPQHQQQLMQMNNPQLMAQQTNKQNIMSLYSQATGQQQQQQPQAQAQAQAQAQVQAQAQAQQPQFTSFGYVQQQPQFTGFAQQAGFAQQQQQQQGGYWRQQ